MTSPNLDRIKKEDEELQRKTAHLAHIKEYKSKLESQLEQLQSSPAFTFWQAARSVLKNTNSNEAKKTTGIPSSESRALSYQFSPVEKPEVSIILITFNKWEYTARCLESLSNYIHSPSFEIVIVDNNSSDQTQEELSKIKNITFIKNTENTGFLEGCNQAAKAAKGTYLFFLNNDTYITENALLPLYKRITADTSIGVVGSRVIFGSNNQLQEAGSMLWKDGSAYGYGRGDDPFKPEYRYAHPVDFCSGVSLLIKRSLFEEIGGFDETFAPAYYEEVDLCLQIWKKGFSVWYEPLSIIYHMEYGSSTPEAAITQMKKNQEKIMHKWGSDLKSKPAQPDSLSILKNRDRRSEQQVLGILTELQTIDGTEEAKHLFTLAKNHPITLFCIHSEGPHMTHVRRRYESAGIEVITDERSFEEFCSSRVGLYKQVVVNPFYRYAYSNHIKKYFPDATIDTSFANKRI